jgi:hypothetical protein
MMNGKAALVCAKVGFFRIVQVRLAISHISATLFIDKAKKTIPELIGIFYVLFMSSD